MVNVLKECDYHQSDERKGMRVSKKEEKKSAHIAHKPSKWRYVYGCNAIYAHLCTGGGDTYFSCVPFTQNVHYNITESTNNWDFLTLFFFSFQFYSVTLTTAAAVVAVMALCSVVCFRFTLSHCVHTFLFSNIGNILKYSRSLQCALTNQLAYFYRAAFSFFAFRWTMLFAVVRCRRRRRRRRCCRRRCPVVDFSYALVRSVCHFIVVAVLLGSWIHCVFLLLCTDILLQ